MFVFARNDEDVAAVQQLRRLVAPALKGNPDVPLNLKVMLGGAEVVLPRPLAEILIKAVDLLGAGQGVDVISPVQEVSAQEAAGHLNVSRPYVMNLIRKGILPHRMVGTHHRIPLVDLIAYKRQQEPRRQAAIENLIHETEEFGR